MKDTGLSPTKTVQRIVATTTIVSIFFAYAFFIFPHSARATQSIEELTDLIQQKKSSIDEIIQEKGQYENTVQQLQSEQLTLENQMRILENNIAQSELDIKRINLQSEQVHLEIEKTNQAIDDKAQQLEEQKKSLSEFLRLLNLNDDVDYLTLLIGYNRFSDFFDQVQHLKDVESQLHGVIEKISTLKQNMESDKIALVKNQQELEKLKLESERKKLTLEDERATKIAIFEKTQDSEFKFQELLAQVRAEKRKLELSLADIENDLKQKLVEQNFDAYQTIDNIDFSWPLPYQGITTYFHDRDYPYKNIVGEHSGIDIRTLIDGRPTVGLPVRSAASGTVVKVINNGNFVGNAVYVVHGINVMTAYYHLSRIDVVPDEYVERGHILGLSGGMPGQYGAGLSNGPHLHFELRVNGLPADPLDYLPAPIFTPIDTIEELTKQ